MGLDLSVSTESDETRPISGCCQWWVQKRCRENRPQEDEISDRVNK